MPGGGGGGGRGPPGRGRAVPRPRAAGRRAGGSEALEPQRRRPPPSSRGAGEAAGRVPAPATLRSGVVNPESRDFYEAGRGHWSGATLGRRGAGSQLQFRRRFVQNVREDASGRRLRWPLPPPPPALPAAGRSPRRGPGGGAPGEAVGEALGCAPLALKTKVGPGAHLLQTRLRPPGRGHRGAASGVEGVPLQPPRPPQPGTRPRGGWCTPRLCFGNGLAPRRRGAALKE